MSQDTADYIVFPHNKLGTLLTAIRGEVSKLTEMLTLYCMTDLQRHTKTCTVMPRLTSDPANEFFD